MRETGFLDVIWGLKQQILVKKPGFCVSPKQIRMICLEQKGALLIEHVNLSRGERLFARFVDVASVDSYRHPATPKKGLPKQPLGIPFVSDRAKKIWLV